MPSSRTLRSLRRGARLWIADRGWRSFLGELLRRAKARTLFGPSLSGAANDLPAHPFDLRHGVETSGFASGETLSGSKPSAADAWATGYHGISPSTFTHALAHLALQTGADWSRFTFVDVGCGKGRAMMLALRYPFRRVVGVELSAGLAEQAVRNLERFHPPWRQEAATEVMRGDATSIPLPDGPLVLFLYHPFAAPVMRRFLAHLQASVRMEPREVYMIYVNPRLDHLVQGTGGLIPIWDVWFQLAEEDRASHLSAAPRERVKAYRV